MPPDGRGRRGENTEAAAQTSSTPTDQVKTDSNGQDRQDHAAAPLRVPEINPDDDALAAALKYAAAGWCVLPVRRGTKHAGSVLGKGWQHAPAATLR